MLIVTTDLTRSNISLKFTDLRCLSPLVAKNPQLKLRAARTTKFFIQTKMSMMMMKPIMFLLNFYSQKLMML